MTLSATRPGSRRWWRRHGGGGPEDAEALDVVGQRLLAEARRQARAVLHDARAEAEEAVGAARREADRLVEVGRDEGEQAGLRAGDATLAVARAEAHSIILASRRRVYDSLRQAALEQIVALASHGEAGALETALASLVRDRVGNDANVAGALSDPAGIVALSGSRRASVTAASVVEAAMEATAAKLAELWE